MSQKGRFYAHYGDISYNVFSSIISLIFKVQTSYFSVCSQETYLIKYSIKNGNICLHIPNI